MKGPSRKVVGTALGLLALLVVLSLFSGSGGARSSVLSRDPEGWAAVRGYLEAQGTEVALLDRNLAESAPGAGTLVLAFPWQDAAWDLEIADAVRGHLNRGGHLLIAYSGSSAAIAESLILQNLDLVPVPARPTPPLGPLAWRRHLREVWRLPAEGGGEEPLRELALPALDQVPDAPASARVLYRSPRNRPVAFLTRDRESRVAVVPAAALANARLSLPGNADLLETLRRSLPSPWSFDELHHGLAAPGAGVEGAAQSRVLDLVLFQVVVLYALFVVVLARRFGPVWREKPVVTGSTAGFFLGLGALHHRLGHHAEAARRLLDRRRDLDPDLKIPEDVARRAEAGVGADGLVDVARALARRHRRTAP